MLGFFVLLILVAAFFGIKFASAKLGNETVKETVAQTTPAATQLPEQEEKPEAVTTPTVTPIATPTPTATDVFEKDANQQVEAIIQKYYQALSTKDIKGIKEVRDELSASDEAQITNEQHLDKYSDVEVYTKKGLNEGDYIVLARYNYKFKGVDALIPGISQLYVRTKPDGNMYISVKEDEAIQNYVDKTVKEPDVQAMVNEVNENYTKVQEENEELKQFLSGYGIASSGAATAKNGETVTVKSKCNVRDKADAGGEVIEKLEAGTKVTKTGTKGEWIQISYEGKTGYVRSDLFE